MRDHSYNALVVLLLMLVLPTQASARATSRRRSWRAAFAARTSAAQVAMDGTSRLLDIRGGDIVHVSPCCLSPSNVLSR